MDDYGQRRAAWARPRAPGARSPAGRVRRVPHTRRVIMNSAQPPDSCDPLGLAADAPLLAAWLDWMRQAESGQLLPMSTPGHKQRYDLVGTVVAGDVPLYGGLDAIKHADRLRADAEARAAALWGADWCRFSVAGSTHGTRRSAWPWAAGPGGDHHKDAAQVAAARPGDGGPAAGLGAAGDRPGYRPAWRGGGADGQGALAAHPDACGVILGDPSYIGTTGDLAGHARAAHEAGVPLIVDQAWAAYLGFHPDLPAHAIAAGADGHGDQRAQDAARLHPGRGGAGQDRTAGPGPAGAARSTPPTPPASQGPSWPASTPPGRCWPGTGSGCAAACCAAWPRPVSGCVRVPGLDVLDGPGVDPAKLVVLLAGTGAHGGLVEADLIDAGMPVEMGDRDTVVPIVTMADDEKQIATFTEALIAAVERHRGQPRRPVATASWTVRPQPVLAPREAFFAPNETVPVSSAVGRSAPNWSPPTRPACRCWHRAS